MQSREWMMEDRGWKERISFPRSSILHPRSSILDPFQLNAPSLLRNINAIPFGIVHAILGKGNPIWTRRAARHAGLFGARLHLFIAFYVKAEMIESDRLFRALIEQRQVEVTVGDEDRG